MSTLIVANKIIKNVAIVNKQKNKLSIRMPTKDSNYFKHDLQCVNMNDKALYDAYKRSCACTLYIDDEAFPNCIATNIRKSRLIGQRIVTFVVENDL